MAQTTGNRKPDYSSATREQLIIHIRYLEGALARLRASAVEHEWLEKIIANSTLTGNQKCAIYGTHKAAAKREPRGDGLTMVFREDISKHGGINEQAASDALKELAEQDHMGRKSENARDEETGQWKRQLFVNIEKFYADPSVEVEKKLGNKGAPWGGKREKRSVCCNAPVKPLEWYQCTCCGQTLKPSEVIEVSEEMLANEAKLQKDLKEIEAQKEEAAAAYPAEIMAMMDAQGTPRLDYRECYICNHNEWLPANINGDWGYLCGHCHPFLATSQGLDLTERKREEIA